MRERRREPQPQISVTQQGGSLNGRGDVRMVPEEEVRSYYGRPVIKEPTWEPDIAWYFFAGGLAGASSGLAFVARLSGNDRLARRALLAALGGATVSPVLLVRDLGRPDRFYNMLRVFKPTSPMSMGTWILTSFGPSAGIAAAGDVLGIFPRLGRFFEGVAAVLVADTSVPVWHEARGELPLIFAASSAASAGAFAMMFTPIEDAGPARRLAIGGALLELGAAQVMERRLGELLAEPYHQGEAGRFDKLAKVFSGLGAGVTAFAGRKRRSAAIAGGALMLAGAACERWSVFRAGFQSARDPKYTVMSQRERLRERDGARGG